MDLFFRRCSSRSSPSLSLLCHWRIYRGPYDNILRRDSSRGCNTRQRRAINGSPDNDSAASFGVRLPLRQTPTTTKVSLNVHDAGEKLKCLTFEGSWCKKKKLSINQICRWLNVLFLFLCYHRVPRVLNSSQTGECAAAIIGLRVWQCRGVG